jgi:lipopolysaccharide biosynthesis glycosyltransferase
VPYHSKIIVTAANAAFGGRLCNLLLSLKVAQKILDFDISCFDLGLDSSNLAQLLAHNVQVITPHWNIRVPLAIQQQHPEYLSLVVRPFLPEYFPNYQNIMWIDADAWVENPASIANYFEIAASQKLAIVPEIDHCYKINLPIQTWRSQRLRQYFGKQAVNFLNMKSFVNAGVFALSAQAPHWQAWASMFEFGLKQAGFQMFCDQTALNYCLWTQSLAAEYLPSSENWLCHLSKPDFDPERNIYTKPEPPHTRLNIVHLTAHSKQLPFCYHPPALDIK